MSTATSKLRSIMLVHVPFEDTFDQNVDCWGCRCNEKTGYYTRGEVIEKHILPLVRAAAAEEVTTKLKRIFEKSGMDLESILKSEETFGEKEPEKWVDDPIAHIRAGRRVLYCKHGNDINLLRCDACWREQQKFQP